MVKVKKNSAVIREDLAILTFFVKPAVLLAAQQAPIVDDPVIPASHVFFIPTVVETCHFAVGIAGLEEQTMDHILNPPVPKGV
jgi:hypothetical protein